MSKGSPNLPANRSLLPFRLGSFRSQRRYRQSYGEDEEGIELVLYLFAFIKDLVGRRPYGTTTKADPCKDRGLCKRVLDSLDAFKSSFKSRLQAHDPSRFILRSPRLSHSATLWTFTFEWVGAIIKGQREATIGFWSWMASKGLCEWGWS